jgi:hypothetical protein
VRLCVPTSSQLGRAIAKIGAIAGAAASRSCSTPSSSRLAAVSSRAANDRRLNSGYMIGGHGHGRGARLGEQVARAIRPARQPADLRHQEDHVSMATFARDGCFRDALEHGAHRGDRVCSPPRRDRVPAPLDLAQGLDVKVMHSKLSPETLDRLFRG